MKKLKIIFAAIALVVSIAGCAKTSQEKAKENADNIVAEHNSILNFLRNAGEPSVDWTDADINNYEAKLNRLDEIEQFTVAKSGQDGVYYTGGQNKRIIEYARARISEIRDEKARRKNGEI